jgi:hypothetical protein
LAGEPVVISYRLQIISCEMVVVSKIRIPKSAFRIPKSKLSSAFCPPLTKK